MLTKEQAYELLYVLIAGGFGGLISIVFSINGGENPIIPLLPFGFIVYILLGMAAGMLGVYVIAKTDTRHFAHCLGFSLACGIAWSPVIDGARALAAKNTDKAKLEFSNENYKAKIDQLTEIIAKKREGNISIPPTFDVTPDKATTARIETLSSVTPLAKSDNGYWIYVGEIKKLDKAPVSTPLTVNLDMKVLYSNHASNNVRVMTDVYKRDNSPYENPKGNWHLGKVIGVLKEDKEINIIDFVEVESETDATVNVWAKVAS